MSDRSKSSELMARMLPHVTALWAHNPRVHSLGQLFPPLEEMGQHTNAVEGLSKIMEELHASFDTLSDRELLGALRCASSVKDEIKGWHELFEITKARLFAEHGEEVAKRRLVGML